MMRSTVSALFALLVWATLPSWAAAQDPATLSGLVTDETGQPLASATVYIPTMNLGSLTNERGRYILIVPAARVSGQQVDVQAQMIGRASRTQSVTLRSGSISVDFQLAADPLNLEEIVVTGSGMATQRQRLGVTINSVRAEDLAKSNETNLIAALAGKAPNVEVTSSAGDPGAGAY